MKSIRAKFQCSEVNHLAYGAQRMKAQVVYAGDKNAEDNTFAKATPSGEIWLQIDNPAAQNAIKPGDYFYADLMVIEPVSFAVPS